MLGTSINDSRFGNKFEKHEKKRTRRPYEARLLLLERLQQEKKEKMRQQREALKAKMAALKK